MPDDAIPIASARKRYAFLGKPLPPISLLDSLSMPNKLPELPAHGATTGTAALPRLVRPMHRPRTRATAERLPDRRQRSLPSTPCWRRLCRQAEAATRQGWGQQRRRHREGRATREGPSTRKPTPREMLAETPTVVVPPAVLTQFAAVDFPFLIIGVAHGIIRVIQLVDEDIVQPGGTLDSALAVVGQDLPAIRPTEGANLRQNLPPLLSPNRSRPLFPPTPFCYPHHHKELRRAQWQKAST